MKKRGERRITEDLWRRVSGLVPPRPGPGRRPTEARRVFEGIVQKLQTGRPWKRLPEKPAASPSALQRQFRRWLEDGFFNRLWRAGLAAHPELRGIPWRLRERPRQPANPDPAEGQAAGMEEEEWEPVVETRKRPRVRREKTKGELWDKVGLENPALRGRVAPSIQDEKKQSQRRRKP